jgi:HAD superfamily hydrolase (TIGR01509 family)
MPTELPARGQIKLVTLDFAHTIAGLDNLKLSRFMNEHFASEVTPVQVMKAEQAFRRNAPRFRSDLQSTSLPIPRNSYDYYAAFVTGCLGKTPEELGEAFTTFAIEANTYHDACNWVMVLWPDSVQALEMLAPHFKLGIISNANGFLERDLSVLGIRHYFAFVLDSGVEGVSKPDAEIFRRALRQADVRPDQALHIGDQPIADIKGAQDVGMHVAHYDAQGIFADSKLTGVPYFRNLVDLAENLIG